MHRFTEQDEIRMRRAWVLAERGRGLVEPNPLVGCVIVRGGAVVGEGYHHKFGGPHAEIHALKKAGPNANGATVYLTLEPCCHHGKTGPCTDALIEAGVMRVVVACKDPFPKVAGKGIAKLRRAGINVEVGLLVDLAQRQNRPYLKRVKTGMPWVIAKWAMTLDGAIANAKGQSQWISGHQSRKEVHELRARMDAIIVGIGTVLADNPRLTARGVKVMRIARRVVIDPQLRIPLDSKLVTTAKRVPLTLVTANSGRKVMQLERKGVEIWTLPANQRGEINLRTVLKRLAKDHAATNILVEGGGKTLGSFFERHLIDEAMIFVAPKLLGDADSVRPIVRVRGGRSIPLHQSIGLALEAVRIVGNDLLLEYHTEG